MKFGVDLGRCHPRLWRDIARAADDLGYESVWMPEHLIFPAVIHGSPSGDAHTTVDPHTPVFDAFVMLASLAAVTERIRLGTHVYNIGLRHPFVTARAVATLDIVSGGRTEFGVGASWLAAEWAVAGLDFATRGARVDEAIRICRRLWTEPEVEHRGRFFTFDPVVFEPKPIQPHVPVHIGGDSRAALRRVAELGDGWIGMIHDLTSFAGAVRAIDELCAARGRAPGSVQRSALVRAPTPAAVGEWTRAGATRLIVAPWPRSVDAVAGLAAFATTMGLRAG